MKGEVEDGQRGRRVLHLEKARGGGERKDRMCGIWHAAYVASCAMLNNIWPLTDWLTAEGKGREEEQEGEEDRGGIR